MQRLINANAFAEKIKEISDKQGYNTFYTDKQSVGEILHSVVDDLTGNTIYGYENCPTVLTIPDNPTFGEVITALIPIEDMWNSYHFGVGKEVCVKFKGCEFATSFDAEYWNAPYKRGTE